MKVNSLMDAVKSGVNEGIRGNGFMASSKTAEAVEKKVTEFIGKRVAEAVLTAERSGRHDVSAALQLLYVNIVMEGK